METNDTPPQKKAIKRRPWPEKHRRKLAKAALTNKAWEHATGPRTEGGKAKSAANARRHGLRSAEITKLRHLLRLQKTYIALCIRSITVLGSTHPSERHPCESRDPADKSPDSCLRRNDAEKEVESCKITENRL